MSIFTYSLLNGLAGEYIKKEQKAKLNGLAGEYIKKEQKAKVMLFDLAMYVRENIAAIRPHSYLTEVHNPFLNAETVLTTEIAS